MTDLRASQTLLEAWVTTTADQLVTSQVLGEVWFQNTPVTMLIASQGLAEVWGQFPTTLPPSARRYRVSASIS